MWEVILILTRYIYIYIYIYTRGRKVMKGTEYFVLLQTSVVLTE